MRPVAAKVAACVLAAVGFGLGGCARQQDRTPPPIIETSYPSPDFPPQGAEPATSRPAGAGGLVERPLAGQTAPRHSPPPPVVSPPAATPPAGERFEAIDADHNGRITLEEWRTFQEREFRRLDRHDDGVLTREEMSSPSPAQTTGRGAPKAP
ncbi:MAG: EF-hand domain-containing protein [Solidesulfovibrio sp.]